jgi:hypothetical protein
MSKRFALKRYLGLTEEEIAENERMWRQENLIGQAGKERQPGQDLRGVGITPGGIQGDMEAADGELGAPDGVEPPGMEAATGAAPQPGSAPPAPTPAA